MLQCRKCGSENVEFTVNVITKFNRKYYHKITKKSFMDKDTELMGAFWDTTNYYCNDCNDSYSYMKSAIEKMKQYEKYQTELVKALENTLQVIKKYSFCESYQPFENEWKKELDLLANIRSEDIKCK